MKPDIKYISTRNTKKMMTLNWKEDTVYQAHSVHQPGLIPYVEKTGYDLAIAALKSGDPEKVKAALTDLGETV